MMKHTFEIQLKTCHRNLRKVFSFNIKSIYNFLLLFISISTVLKLKIKERKKNVLQEINLKTPVKIHYKLHVW